MSIQAIRAEKNGKYFHRNGLRRTVLLLLMSLFINLLFIAAIYNIMLNKVEPNYYSTSGVKPPILLKALSQPNYSSTPLLDPSPDPNASKDGKKR